MCVLAKRKVFLFHMKVFYFFYDSLTSMGSLLELGLIMKFSKLSLIDYKSFDVP